MCLFVMQLYRTIVGGRSNEAFPKKLFHVTHHLDHVLFAPRPVVGSFSFSFSSNNSNVFLTLEASPEALHVPDDAGDIWFVDLFVVRVIHQQRAALSLLLEIPQNFLVGEV